MIVPKRAGRADGGHPRDARSSSTGWGENTVSSVSPGYSMSLGTKTSCREGKGRIVPTMLTREARSHRQLLGELRADRLLGQQLLKVGNRPD
jgi:hypothetical protein